MLATKPTLKQINPKMTQSEDYYIDLLIRAAKRCASNPKPAQKIAPEASGKAKYQGALGIWLWVGLQSEQMACYR